MTSGEAARGEPLPERSPLAPGAPTLPASGRPSLPAMSRRREILYFAARTKKVVIGLAIILFFLILAIVGPVIRPGDPDAFVGPLGVPPSSDWWFGTTSFGQDIFAQFVYGLGSTFLVGFLGGGLPPSSG